MEDNENTLLVTPTKEVSYPDRNFKLEANQTYKCLDNNKDLYHVVDHEGRTEWLCKDQLF